MSTDIRHDHTVQELRADVVLPMDALEARDRLQARLLAGQQGDVDEAIPVRLVVGPRRELRLPGKQVRGEVLPPHEHGNSLVFPLHWEAIGLGAAVYPALDANVAITPIDETSCLLSFLGRYVPPLGTLGAIADRLAMSRVADATAEAVVTRLADVLRDRPPRPVGV